MMFVVSAAKLGLASMLQTWDGENLAAAMASSPLPEPISSTFERAPIGEIAAPASA